MENDEIRQHVLKNYASFVGDVDPDLLSDYLKAKSIISIEQWQDICGRNTAPRSRCRALLDFLLTGNDPRAFLVVRDVLKKNNHYLLDIIVEENKTAPEEDGKLKTTNESKQILLAELSRENDLLKTEIQNERCEKECLRSTIEKQRIDASKEEQTLKEDLIKEKSKYEAHIEKLKQELDNNEITSNALQISNNTLKLKLDAEETTNNSLVKDLNRCETTLRAAETKCEKLMKELESQGVPMTNEPPTDARSCYATGRGIQPNGVRVGDDADFKVHIQYAGDGDLNVKVIGPGGIEERIRVRKLDAVTYECIYTPKKPGHYVVNVNYGGQPITESPFKVKVGPTKEMCIRTYGPGLEEGVVGYAACFTVEINGDTASLKFSIEGPSQVKIDCKDNGDRSADISYWPTAPGEYAVHILCNEEDIPKSPYMADIKPMTADFDPTKVEASGPSLQKTGVTVNKWAEFTVDTSRAGRAPLHIAAVDADNPVDVIIKDNKDGTYFCRYMPRSSNQHTIIISYGGVSIPNSPYRATARSENERC